MVGKGWRASARGRWRRARWLPRWPKLGVLLQDPNSLHTHFENFSNYLMSTHPSLTTYHPQLDRATEQVNQEIEVLVYLSIYCLNHPEDWHKSLGTLEFMHNKRRHADQNHLPFELILGDSPITIPVMFQHTKFLLMEEKIKCMINDRDSDVPGLAQIQKPEAGPS
jgi:hypothetical protein